MNATLACRCGQTELFEGEMVIPSEPPWFLYICPDCEMQIWVSEKPEFTNRPEPKEITLDDVRVVMYGANEKGRSPEDIA